MPPCDVAQVNLGVSVVIPTYNAAASLPSTIDSVLAQQWPDVEVVAVDDGSTDETPALLDSYKHRYPSIFRVVRQPNLGPAAARNTGILAASRPFVAFLDSDDVWLPEKLSRQMAFASDRKLEFSATGMIDRSFDQPKPRNSIIADWDDSPEQVLHRLMIHNDILTSSFVATRRALVDVGLFDESISPGDDYDLWLRVAAAGYRIGYVPEALTVYARSPEGVSFTFHRKGIDPYLPVMTRRFSAEDLPQPIQARRRWYLAHRHLNNAVGYLDGGHYRRTVTSLARAFWLRPASARPGWVLIAAKAVAGMIGRTRVGQRGGATPVPASPD